MFFKPRKLKTLVVSFLVLTTSGTLAAEPGGIKRNATALQLIERCLNNSGMSPEDTLKSVRELQPSGPEFFSKVLDLLLVKKSVWGGYYDYRPHMLNVLVEQVSANDLDHTWSNVRGTELFEKIHRQLQEILEFSPKHSDRKDSVIYILNILDMWDESDIQFLMRASRNRNPYTSQALAWVLLHFDERTRRQAIEEAKFRRNLATLASFLEYNILKPKDYESVLKLRLRDVDFTPFYRSEQKVKIDSKWTSTKHRADQQFVRLLREYDSVFFDLFERYRDGKLRAKSAEDLRARRTYMEALWKEALPNIDPDDKKALRSLACQRKLK